MRLRADEQALLIRWSWRAGRRIRADVRLAGQAAWRALVKLIAEGTDFTYASSIAYYALLSLFPCLMLLFVVLGIVTADEADRATVLRFVLRYFPGQFDFVAGQLDLLRRTRVELSILGSFAIVWASLGVFRAITSAVNHAWGVERQPSYLRHQLVSFTMLVAAGLLLLLALLLMSTINLVQASWFASVIERLPGLVALRVVTGFAFRYAATLLLIFVVGLVFYFVPNTEVRFRDVWLGAILTGLLWRLALAGFSWYVKEPSRLSVHGSIAAVVAFLIWVYVSAAILLYGVEFTAAHARLRGRQRCGV